MSRKRFPMYVYVYMGKGMRTDAHKFKTQSCNNTILRGCRRFGGNIARYSGYLFCWLEIVLVVALRTYLVQLKKQR